METHDWMTDGFNEVLFGIEGGVGSEAASC